MYAWILRLSLMKENKKPFMNFFARTVDFYGESRCKYWRICFQYRACNEKMGGNVELLGMVSNDAFGRMILNEMRMYDVADSMIVSEEGETSYSVILTPEGIDRIILHHSGVNEEFCLKHIELKKLKMQFYFILVILR